MIVDLLLALKELLENVAKVLVVIIRELLDPSDRRRNKAMENKNNNGDE